MKCVISGSFRKHYDDIRRTISDFEELGVEVLSPMKSSIINPNEAFTILETDTSNDPKKLEEDHLNAIRQCDFLYICDIGGYIGASTLLEIGFAIAVGKKIYCIEQPKESIISILITGVGSPKKIVHIYATA